MAWPLQRDPPPQGRLTRFWRFWLDQLGGMRIVFGDGLHEKQLTLTFNFLSGLVGLLFILTAVWAIAAGLLHTGQLAQQYKMVFPHLTPHWMWWFVLIAGVFVYSGEAFGVALMVFLAAASVGAIAGFLFGVPRPISESGSASASPAPMPPSQGSAGGGAFTNSPTVAASSPRTVVATPGWQANTNLTQISDWLTKIMVGIGLVEASKVARVAIGINTFVTTSLFGGSAGVVLAMPALMIAGLIFGFIYSYLFTQLFLATLMARTAIAIRESVDLLQDKRDDAIALNRLPVADPLLASPIQFPGSDAPNRSSPQPSEPLRAAARNIVAVPLSEVNDPSSMTVWARAQAVLDQWGPAVIGYSKLLIQQRTPEILAEAARVFAAAKDFTGASELINEAAQKRDRSESPTTRVRITFDAAHLALYKNPPEGYREALNLLDHQAIADDVSGGLHVLRACANGQRLKHESSGMTEPKKEALRQSIYDDLLAATRPANLEWIRYLLGRDVGGDIRPTKEGNQEDDDLLEFKDDPRFLRLIGIEPPATL